MNRLFWQAIFAFLALPGVVAFIVPGLILRPAQGGVFHWIGVIPVVIGSALLLWCVRDFYVAGRGTLAPWTPPKRLVAVGLYRFSRNPMYIAVISVLIGWALLFQTTALVIYAVSMTILFHLRVVIAEEPFLARTHGKQWEEYRSRVPRWLANVKRE
jgi:protein-S-isoprenylcysteine O-methyltransferase Ste14